MSKAPKVPDRASSVPSAGSSRQIEVPIRTSSKRTFADTDEAKEHEANLLTRLQTQQKKLKPTKSQDSQFWADTVSMNETSCELVNTRLQVTFLEYQESGGTLKFSEWEEQEYDAINLRRQASAISLKERLARDHIDKLQRNPGHEAMVKLFCQHPAGFNHPATASGPRKCRDQRQMRSAMSKAYCNKDLATADGLWDPVLHVWLNPELARAAHLYPWKSVHCFDAIFGKGSKSEIFTPLNGLFLHEKVEKALELGKITFVPDIDFDSPDSSNSKMSLKEVVKKRMSDWTTADVKEYRVRVLIPKDCNDIIWPQLSEPHYTARKLSDLHNRPLKFITSYRPRARYMWWVHCSAVIIAGFNAGVNNAAMDSAVVKEVEKGMNYWGTPGKYMRSEMLQALANHIGHDLEVTPAISSIRKGFVTHALDDDAKSPSPEPDPTALLVITNQALANTAEVYAHHTLTEE